MAKERNYNDNNNNNNEENSRRDRYENFHSCCPHIQ